MPLDTQLNMLESSGLIRLAATRPDLEYIFRHALMQDAAYQSLPKGTGMQLHAAVGEALERLYDYQPGKQQQLWHIISKRPASLTRPPGT